MAALLVVLSGIEWCDDYDVIHMMQMLLLRNTRLVVVFFADTSVTTDVAIPLDVKKTKLSVE